MKHPISPPYLILKVTFKKKSEEAGNLVASKDVSVVILANTDVNIVICYLITNKVSSALYF